MKQFVVKTEGNTTSISSRDGDVEYTYENLDINPEDLMYGRGTDKYTPEQKIQAAMHWLVSGGSAIEASKKTGVPSGTIRAWKHGSPWWPDVIRKLRAIKQDELDAMFTVVIHDTVGEIHDRVLEGDWKYDPKTGEKVRVPMSGRDLAQTAQVLFDKRSLLRGDPTSLRKEVSVEDSLKKIGENLVKNLKQAKAEKVVSEQ